MSYNRNSTTQW